MDAYRMSEAAFHTMNYAMILSDLRKSARQDACDWLGAIYLANLDRVSRYWGDPGQLEGLVMADPAIADNMSALKSRFPISVITHRGAAGGAFKPFTSAFSKIWSRAIEVAQRSNKDEKPMVFPEHFLLAIAERVESELGNRLVRSGLRVEDLRRDVERGITS